jgi:hypothetical protein
MPDEPPYPSTPNYPPASSAPYEPPARPEEKKGATNVLELLDRILDKGLVIVGDIRVSVADIELLKIQIRLLIASVDKAKELGIDFSWAKEIESTKTKEELEQKIKGLQAQLQNTRGQGAGAPSESQGGGGEAGSPPPGQQPPTQPPGTGVQGAGQPSSSSDNPNQPHYPGTGA